MAENEIVLLRRFAETGDAEAFSQIVHRHAGLVYGACLRVLQDRSQAADAVQETFLQLLREAGSITSSVPSWLHRVATRKALQAIRRDSRRRQREAKYAADRPLKTSRWEDISIYVDEELDELDDQTRQILVRHFFEGTTTIDIAADSGISQPTVSRRIEAGVTELREKLKRRGIIVAAAALGSLLTQNAAQAAPAIVLKELGKIALVGGSAAASGVGTTVAAKAAATGTVTGVKAKVIAAAAVAVIGAGTVVTYKHITRPVEPPQRQKQVVAEPVPQPRGAIGGFAAPRPSRQEPPKPIGAVRISGAAKAVSVDSETEVEPQDTPAGDNADTDAADVGSATPRGMAFGMMGGVGVSDGPEEHEGPDRPEEPEEPDGNEPPEPPDDE